ncbi:hypothetical protein [Pseudonocardia sp. WMMC193]|uniref:hypothetical protein n=1 Tax=Pseudonocardia sp. WMMC193 TaxID=2911965 RepID=UPI001F3DE797|nr:hypothetical protein [Pseudonocardia sp. WMMC193]MCF7553851.1 hypothetical protein [Pseudonocardia sp. WMMC193]
MPRSKRQRYSSPSPSRVRDEAPTAETEASGPRHAASPPPSTPSPGPPRERRFRLAPYVATAAVAFALGVLVGTQDLARFLAPAPPGEATAVDTGEPTGDAPAYPGAEDGDVVGAAGDTLVVGGLQVSASLLRAGAADGPPTVCTTVSVSGAGGITAAVYDSEADWHLQNPQGLSTAAVAWGSSALLGAGEAGPGSTVSGDVCFDRTGLVAGQYSLLFRSSAANAPGRGVWVTNVVFG